MKQQKISEDPKVTAIGGVLGLGGVVLSIIPPDVRDACFTSVSSSGNPLVVAVLVSAGLLLTFVGPSLAKKGAKVEGDSNPPSPPAA